MKHNTYLLISALALAVLPGAVLAQAPSGPPPLPPLGRPISDLDLENRLRDAQERNRDGVATLELSYQSSGDLWSSMKKTNPQGLFVTIEVNGSHVKNIAKGKKPKIQEAVPTGVLDVKARLSRPGKRLETKCFAELTVGYHQVIFLPYGGEEGYFSCQVLPRLLPDELVAEWKEGFDDEQKQAFATCASTHARGGTAYWTCIESAGIPFPQG